MKTVNRSNEKFFLKKVEDGYLTVKRNGTVYNNDTGRFIGYTGKKGYISIGVKDLKGKTRHILVHRLVWLTYKGYIPDDVEVNHIDGIKSNNKLSNLELVTGSDNMKHAYCVGLLKVEEERNLKYKKIYGGEKGYGSKITNRQVLSMRDFYKKRKNLGWTQKRVAEHLSEKTGINFHTIKKMLSGKTYDENYM